MELEKIELAEMDGWDIVSDTLYKGSKKDIDQLICPECYGVLEYEYDPEYSTLKVKCIDCGTFTKEIGVPEGLNCVAYYGNKHRIEHPKKELAHVG